MYNKIQTFPKKIKKMGLLWSWYLLWYLFRRMFWTKSIYFPIVLISTIAVPFQKFNLLVAMTYVFLLLETLFTDDYVVLFLTIITDISYLNIELPLFWVRFKSESIRLLQANYLSSYAPNLINITYNVSFIAYVSFVIYEDFFVTIRW